MKGERPEIRDELEVLEENVKKELLRLGWEMEQDGTMDCDEEEVAMCKEGCVASYGIGHLRYE